MVLIAAERQNPMLMEAIAPELVPVFPGGELIGAFVAFDAERADVVALPRIVCRTRAVAGFTDGPSAWWSWTWTRP